MERNGRKWKIEEKNGNLRKEMEEKWKVEEKKENLSKETEKKIFLRKKNGMCFPHTRGGVSEGGCLLAKAQGKP